MTIEVELAYDADYEHECVRKSIEDEIKKDDSLVLESGFFKETVGSVTSISDFTWVEDKTCSKCK